MGRGHGKPKRKASTLMAQSVSKEGEGSSRITGKGKVGEVVVEDWDEETVEEESEKEEEAVSIPNEERKLWFDETDQRIMFNKSVKFPNIPTKYEGFLNSAAVDWTKELSGRPMLKVWKKL
ncbi:unnamed protein product [Vicia faba]|uniref:Uncharacterized protein n=1 Tax=Vicia faba TaxID=3906 RepID=A0AAV1A6M6_VICFA|nr:unnamed protein product [Vicia faba]